MIIESIIDIDSYLPIYEMVQNKAVLLKLRNSKNVTATEIVGLDEEIPSQGAGFGDHVTNKIVEDAAIKFVTNEFEKKGWIVNSTEREKCGYDLICKFRLIHTAIPGIIAHSKKGKAGQKGLYIKCANWNGIL